ncbi:thiamine phosphate synthase [Marinobacter sp. BGYM27]|uniref:thiamine phosphate synthase n=1 Tax=Marinobacter sp. BGYM27 TaxID=2975597 RepID=UPI0021A33838|nr:thiamine phosphate synthase [Marinobacter sp. BGYM27]MDG5499772.1 thiamine phosphate synthase [Marinobacter sp. BGYM27]
MNTPFVPRGLYAITDPELLPESRLIPSVAAAIRGGAVLIQYRDKTATDTDKLRRAKNLASLCREAQVPLLINDDARLARRAGADGVHLGQSDDDLVEARTLLGENAIIGVTCHADLELAHQAIAGSADYVAFGRFFSSMTKPGASNATVDILTQARKLNHPISAIGGITLENAPLVLAHGADLLAVIGGLFATDDIEARARAYSRLFQAQHSV